MVILGYIWNLSPAYTGDPLLKNNNNNQCYSELTGTGRAWDSEGPGRERIRFGLW